MVVEVLESRRNEWEYRENGQKAQSRPQIATAGHMVDSWGLMVNSLNDVDVVVVFSWLCSIWKQNGLIKQNF